MMDSDLELRAKAEDLGRRIAQKVAELQAHGILHGDLRQQAADLEIQRARLNEKVKGRSIAGTVAAEVSMDVEILRHSFERWLARLDQRSEGLG